MPKDGQETSQSHVKVNSPNFWLWPQGRTDPSWLSNTDSTGHATQMQDEDDLQDFHKQSSANRSSLELFL